MSDRFSRLEPSRGLPERLTAALSRLARFDQLEIGDAKQPPSQTAAPSDKRLCRHCHQVNEAAREMCWACCKPLTESKAPRPDPGQEIAVVIDGTSYHSSDPNVPPSIRQLMERIRVHGYSDDLFKQWKQETQSQQSFDAPQGKSEPTPVEAWKGQRVSILRLDGKLYKSDDSDLPPEIQEIFGYIERDGVTPQLMQHLRLYGTLVKYRPLATVEPSDGDLRFWDAVKKISPPAKRDA